MTINSFDAVQLEAVIRRGQARLARVGAPDARAWESDPAVTLEDISEILHSARFAPEYPTLGRFVDDFLARHYHRQLQDVHDIRWCPEWWEHDEVEWTLDLLWKSYEHVRATGSAAEMLDWRLQLRVHMQDLMATDGPMRYCTLRNGHKSELIQGICSNSGKAPARLYTEPSTPAVAIVA